MMLVLGALLHVIMGVFAGLANFAFFSNYLKTKNVRVAKIAILFFFMTLYTLFMGIPLLLDPHNLRGAAVGFMLGMGVVVLIFISGTYAIPFGKDTAIERSKNKIMWTTGISGALLLLIGLVDLRNPIIHETGLIFWNINYVAAWGYGVLCILVPWLWGYSYYKMYKLIDSKDTISRLKALTLSADGYMWGVACFAYLIPQIPGIGITQLILAFFLMLLSLSVTAFVFWFARLHHPIQLENS